MKIMTLSKAGMSALAFSILVSGCASVTISPQNQPKLLSNPTYEDKVDFFFWGLSPDAQEVSVNEVCAGSGVRQMQAQTTFENGLFGLLTLGIWSPRTVKIWCEDA